MVSIHVGAPASNCYLVMTDESLDKRDPDLVKNLEANPFMTLQVLSSGKQVIRGSAHIPVRHLLFIADGHGSLNIDGLTVLGTTRSRLEDDDADDVLVPPTT